MAPVPGFPGDGVGSVSEACVMLAFYHSRRRADERCAAPPGRARPRQVELGEFEIRELDHDRLHARAIELDLEFLIP